MDFSGFAGKRKPLTWVRTPLHDREVEQRQKWGNGHVKQGSNSTDEESKRKSDTISASNPASIIRDLSLKFLTKEKEKPRKVCFAPPDPVSERKISAHVRRDKKRWNALHFLVGGQHFQSPEWIFDGHSTTLLGDLEKRKVFFNKKRNSYEFPEILPDVFIAVLEFYRTGSLTRPDRLTLNFFLEQLEVFALEKSAIHYLLEQEGVQKRRRHEEMSTKKLPFRRKLWNVLDNPQSSFGARLYSCVSLFITVLSVLLFVIETLPELRSYSLVNRTSLANAFQSPLFAINTVCFAFFSVELILRLVSCPRKSEFLRSWTNWTDFLSIIPFIVTFILLGTSYFKTHGMSISVLTAIRACRLFLLTRIFGTSRHHRQQWIVILATTLWNNIETLFVLFFLMIICMIGFGGVLYAFEGAGSENPTFPTIPWGMWMAIETLTTVGYGDVAPKKALAQITAIFCGCVGLMFVGFVLESVTYEYHRLMKANSQYRRYLTDLECRRQASSQAAVGLRKITTCHTSLMLLALNSDDIHISVNGADFYLSLAELNRHPNSLLGHPCKRSPYYNPNTGSYFFPRNQDIFPSLHHFYRCPGSVLKRPNFISLQRFVEEIEFFQLSPQAVIDFFAYEGIRLVEEEQPKNPVLHYWHLVLNHPRYNALSRCIMILSLFCTGVFILNIVLESLPSLLNFSCATALSNVDTSGGSNDTNQNSTVSKRTFTTGVCRNELAFFVLETICTCWFLLELCARFCVAPSKSAFLKYPMNWVDLIIISPYIFTVIQFAAPTADANDRLFAFFRTMRLLRLISIVKFSRYFRRIQMIFAILQSTWTELLMLCYFMLINAVIFGTIIFLVELNGNNGESDDFNSIPRSMYWAWITMLTIGYGDMVPATVGGKVCAAGVSILGIVFWTLPMTLISDHFANFRRLYEGQDYLMLCLTRMYHLLATSESKREEKKISICKSEANLEMNVPDQSTEISVTSDSSPQPLISTIKRPSSTNFQVRRSSTKPDLQFQMPSPKLTRRFSRMAFDGIEFEVAPQPPTRRPSLLVEAEEPVHATFF